MSPLLRLLALGCSLLLPAGVALADSAGMQEIGAHVVHYNALPAEHIDAELAARHDLPRERNLVVVTLAVMTREGSEAVSADIRAHATDAEGRLYPFELREIRDGHALFYVGTVALDDASSALEFTLQVRPEQAPAPQGVRFTRRFNRPQ
jgi:hypothetical protein